ncbi:hypothetical protein PCASD_18773 [Puccinia coronata f. sp. avenae]|uniref:Uncharacterized protein n=1 Tax=Puccinia coronata f. sp. avenae TaxID=200324 RepID=A0A2N5SNB4_9BASI|nr:hypothetical protein PCASD_18773 [Puccinia coronata f. sp. avenae]
MQGEQNTPLLPRKSYFIFNLEDHQETICVSMAVQPAINLGLDGPLLANELSLHDAKAGSW